MNTKALIIDIATSLFQQKGYKGVGLNEIIKASKISKGALYHHFPNGKEELLIACLQSLDEAITKDIEGIFERYPTTQEATKANAFQNWSPVLAEGHWNQEHVRAISENAVRRISW